VKRNELPFRSQNGKKNNALFRTFLPCTVGCRDLSPFSLPVEAVADPEIIQWRATQNADFLNSLFMGVLGRGPSLMNSTFTSHGT
jgi:hypothetical protein